MSLQKTRSRAGAFLLITPLALFILVFFLWPLASMLQTAVLNNAVSQGLPKTSAAMADWTGVLPVPKAVQYSLAEDIKSAQTPQRQQQFGRAVQQLNAAASGFRSLMIQTQTAVKKNPEIETLNFDAVDPRWSEEKYWLALKQASKPLTDKNLLAAVDLARDLHGDIKALPEELSANGTILQRTFAISAYVTVICILLGVPYALVMARATKLWRSILLVAVLIPLWTSLLVRSAAWVVLLQDHGLVNDTLHWLGLISDPLPLIFNRPGVLIAMSQVLLPFMVLPVYSALIAIPPNLIMAASSLGANPVVSFIKVLLPLFRHGIFSGSLLVFMTALGYYITPALVGGAKDQMISSIIAFYAIETANWGMAAALGVVLLIATFVLYAVYSRYSRPGISYGN